MCYGELLGIMESFDVLWRVMGYNGELWKVKMC